MQLIQTQMHPSFPGLFLHHQAMVLPLSMGMVHPLKHLLIYPMLISWTIHSPLVSDGDANDSITINLTINPVMILLSYLMDCLILLSLNRCRSNICHSKWNRKIIYQTLGCRRRYRRSTQRPKGGGGGYTESTITVPQNEDSLTIIVGQKEMQPGLPVI